VPAACRFEPLGIAPDRTAVLADPTISAFEGAAVLSRAAPRPDKCCATALTTPGWLSARPADAQNARFWRTNALAGTPADMRADRVLFAVVVKWLPGFSLRPSPMRVCLP